ITGGLQTGLMALRTIFRIQIVLTATLVTGASKGDHCALKSANACSWYAAVLQRPREETLR
ncbi:MAG: hypothetical protein WB504_09410, partial [Pseudolabrys sp.]